MMVKQLIEELKKFNQDAIVEINLSNTNQSLTIENVHPDDDAEYTNNYVYIIGDNGNRKSHKPG